MNFFSNDKLKTTLEFKTQLKNKSSTQQEILIYFSTYLLPFIS